MVTGANAVGKSFISRDGLAMEVKKGHIDKPCDDTGRLDIKDIFLVPQRVYMVLDPLGTDHLPLITGKETDKSRRR